MHRFTLLPLFVLLAALMPRPAAAYGEQAVWIDKSVAQPLRQTMLLSSPWRVVPKSLEGLSPKPEIPLTLQSACTDKIDSAFYREMEARGATFISSKECRRLILWAAAGRSGVTYTFEELRKNFAPVENEAEAAAFLFATGRFDNAPWYGAVLEGAIYIMATENYCKGLGQVRRIFRIIPDGTAEPVARINAPPPKGSPCSGASN